MPPVRLGARTYDDSARLVMGIVNATPDSFYDRGRAYALAPALEQVAQMVADGADVIDVGGVKAGLGPEVTPVEEIARVEALVGCVREKHPDVAISVDTWRAEVARAVLPAGADLVNDAWGSHDPQLAEVAAEFGASLVCTHTGGLTPRTYTRRVRYPDLVGDVTRFLESLAERAIAAGVSPDRVVLDPGHDFNKNTWHSLELTRRLDELVRLGRPVLVAPSNKDFVGETLDLPVGERIEGTMATVAVCAWQGARIFRVHEVRQARRTVDMVTSIIGDRPPARVVRTLP
ncbi:dihydropteroate synthase [Pseudonocardia hierapolitana]|uniref:Dihydropteroate synthase n=1 Tax=Pseudonocardia hierapolitana TaxID=1128676 RepID=A0A561SNF0_9PSEU|nr:dihydropteroate synthase [Pseudonocardia hierapolitana]TWF76376.1 dihydropteroate synthase [Pseudonocardia hierapolitana]